MIFLTEGQSAAGSIVSCRDVTTQAIFVLKGKPLNVWDLKRDIVYRNDEMYNLMRSLDIEDNIERLRYEKVILATDADVDGLHIRNLLITYFFRFFEQLVHDGHLFVLETPLFRVRNKEQTIYCYSEAERDAALAKLGKNAEITRFKGLGEITPSRIQAIHRRRNEIEPGGIRPQARRRRHPGILHGQKHPRAQRLHHGKPGRAGGGLTGEMSKAAQSRLPRCGALINLNYEQQRNRRGFDCQLPEEATLMDIAQQIKMAAGAEISHIHRDDQGRAWIDAIQRQGHRSGS